MHNNHDRQKALSILAVVIVACLLIAADLARTNNRTASADGSVFYDFIAQAAYASWFSGAGSLPFPGSDSDNRGFALYRDDCQLEDDGTYPRVLETHPQWVSNGWIMGRYPQITVPAEAELKVTLGFLKGATGTDGATFEVQFEEGQNRHTIISRYATYDGHLDSATANLSSLAGKTGCFSLYVNAGKGSGQDWAAWIGAKIEVAAPFVDSDKDGIPDDKDNCPQNYNPKQEDADKDGIGDACDQIPEETKPPRITLTLSPPQPKPGDTTRIQVTAFDESSIEEIIIFLGNRPIKRCPQSDYCQTEFIFSPLLEIHAAAIDADRNVNIRDILGSPVDLDLGDDDGDGEVNSFDNCRNDPNADQRDTDHDGVGDACDECDPVRTHGAEGVDESWDFVDSNGCGCDDTDDGLAYFTQGELRKQKRDDEIRCVRVPGRDDVPPICTDMVETVASDSCLAANKVREYYFVDSSGEIGYRDFDCPDGCEDGSCVCSGSDSDGGRNYYSRGCLSPTVCDSCLNDYQLLERYREMVVNRRGEETCQTGSERYDCPIGCQEGACLCQDSDGVVNYEIRGNVGRAGEDYCSDNRTLVEYSVRREGDTCFIVSHPYRCPGSCSEGRCLPPTCDDSIRNQGETNIDCGGPCTPCGLVRISGRILYEEADASAGSNTPRGFKPVRFVNVVLYDDYSAGAARTAEPVLTDSQGYFSFVVSRRAGAQYHVRIGAYNYAARVERDWDGCNEYIRWASIPIEIPATGDVDFGDLRIGIDTDLEFGAYWYENPAWYCAGEMNLNFEAGRSQYFNIAESILLAREYAWAHQGDGFDDTIAQVDVQYPDSDWNNYNNVWSEITLTSPTSPENSWRLDYGFVDATIIHEYGHHLQYELAAYDIPDYLDYDGDGEEEHSMCGRVGDYETAFSEGFANYFSYIVYHHYRDPSHPNFVSPVTYRPASELENGCPDRTGYMEGNVMSALWDLVDEWTYGSGNFPDSIDERFDRISGKEDFILGVLDGEMDNISDAPDICEMRDCYGRRGTEYLPNLDSIFEACGIDCSDVSRGSCGGRE